MKLPEINKDFFVSILGLVIAVAALVATIATPVIRSFFGLSSIERIEETAIDKLKQLDQVELTMKQLQSFIDNQRKELTETNEVLLQLKSKKNELQSIVNAEEATVEAIFRLQEKRAAANIWYERFVGFLIGVISSIIASIILDGVSIKMAKRRNDQLKQPTAQP